MNNTENLKQIMPYHHIEVISRHGEIPHTRYAHLNHMLSSCDNAFTPEAELSRQRAKLSELMVKLTRFSCKRDEPQKTHQEEHTEKTPVRLYFGANICTFKPSFKPFDR